MIYVTQASNNYICTSFTGTDTILDIICSDKKTRVGKSDSRHQISMDKKSNKWKHLNSSGLRNISHELSSAFRLLIQGHKPRRLVTGNRQRAIDVG